MIRKENNYSLIITNADGKTETTAPKYIPTQTIYYVKQGWLRTKVSEYAVESIIFTDTWAYAVKDSNKMFNDDSMVYETKSEAMEQAHKLERARRIKVKVGE